MNEINLKNNFLLELADLLEKHKVYITSPNDDPKERVFSYVDFIYRSGCKSLTTEMQRCHVSPYDLRCASGMSSKQANDLYQANKIK